MLLHDLSFNVELKSTKRCILYYEITKIETIALIRLYGSVYLYFLEEVTVTVNFCFKSFYCPSADKGATVLLKVYFMLLCIIFQMCVT